MKNEKCVYCREYGNLPCEKCDKKDKSKVYLDLSKCSEGEIKEVEKIVGFKIVKISKYPYIIFIWGAFNQSNKIHITERTEISFTAFKEMLGSGEGNTDVQLIKIQTLDEFKSLKKGDLVVVKWKLDMYFGNKKGRFGTYEIVENKERTTEIILQTKHNVYFNYMMFLFPEEHGVSNCESIYLINSNR